ncbi:hypothetical protein MKW92_034955, partial [Papaver armeniacum]
MEPSQHFLVIISSPVTDLSLSWSLDLDHITVRVRDLEKSSICLFSTEKIGLIRICLISLSWRPLLRAPDHSGANIFSLKYVTLILIDLSLGLELVIQDETRSIVQGERSLWWPIA